MQITKKQAREFLLNYQRLMPKFTLTGKQGIMDYFNQVGSIQYDPLSIIDLNPHLVLQSRIKDYNRSDLGDLLYQDRLLIDDWDKCMSIYPLADWPYFKRYREKGFRVFGKEDLTNHPILDEIKAMIVKQGPISTKELDYKEKVNWFWQNTNIAKVALESMYYWGELIIHHKEGIRKYYDLASKHIPENIYQQDDPNTTMEDFYKWILKRRIGSIGLLWDKPGDAFIGIYFMKSKERKQAFQSLLQDGEIIQITIEDIDTPFYIQTSELHLLNQILQGLDYKKEVSFIAPLDNLIWDRKLIKALFNFEYTWEVYKPQQERQFGYYVLPVLYGDTFIARFEPKFNKKEQQLDIINWWWEDNVRVTKTIKKEIEKALKQFMNYLGTTSINWMCTY